MRADVAARAWLVATGGAPGVVAALSIGASSIARGGAFGVAAASGDVVMGDAGGVARGAGTLASAPRGRAMTRTPVVATNNSTTTPARRRARGVRAGVALSSSVTGMGVSGGARSGEAKTPPPLRFMRSSACDDDGAASAAVEPQSARMSMSDEDSVVLMLVLVAAGALVALNAASENSTLLSLRSPTRGGPSLVASVSLVTTPSSAPAVARPAKRSAPGARRLSSLLILAGPPAFAALSGHISPRSSGSTAKVSPHRLQRTFTLRPFRRSSGIVYLAAQPGHVSFISRSDVHDPGAVCAKKCSNRRPSRDVQAPDDHPRP
ncbi:MAG TPA: hypothetical protein VM204_05410, partial [Gaiellaceae bacterium]|nr:hypothetical protein [Gaiellaceae bacterium]